MGLYDGDKEGKGVAELRAMLALLIALRELGTLSISWPEILLLSVTRLELSWRF